jgi:transcription antitermination factor NusG
LNWYAVYTKHHHEKKVADLLARKGTETFLPLFSSVHLWKDRKQTVSSPLFTGYIFVRSDLADRVGILSTPGVFFIVENAGKACPIPDDEIEAIRAVVASGRRFEPHPYLQAGERIRMVRGPLVGISGFFTKHKNRNRIVVTIELLQKALSVEVDISDVESVSEDRRARAAGSHPQ